MNSGTRASRVISLSSQIAHYKNREMKDLVRAKDLLSRMTPEVEAAQMMCVWRKKATKLVDAQGNFDFKKAKAAFKEGWGIGRVGRPSEAGSNPKTPTDGRNARQMAELTNAIRKFSPEHSRLHIPVSFHEECPDGHAANDGTSFPQPIGLVPSSIPSRAGLKSWLAVPCATRIFKSRF